jgi:hypothetical protein
VILLSKVTEQLHVSETDRITADRRLEYGAVPLDPWKAHNVDDLHEPYVASSTRRIKEKTHEAISCAMAEGWVATPELAVQLAELIEVSLYDSQMMRVQRNDMAQLGDRAAKDDPRIIRAEQGMATPDDLLSALIDYPLLGSLELAKLSHPLDADATRQMDEDVFGAIAERMEAIEIVDPRFKTKSLREDIPAATILRKQLLASQETPHGTLHVVQRKAFLVRGDSETGIADPYMDRKVRSRTRHEEELHPKVDSYLQYAADLPDQKWLQPLSTSYYGFYRDNPGSSR